MAKTFNRTPIVLMLLLVGVGAFVYYWRTSTEHTPGDYEAKKGNYRLEDGQLDRAIKQFNLSLDRNPEHAGAHLGLAITYMQKGEMDTAIDYFTRTLKLDDKLAVAYADRGILYDRLGKYTLAIADYKRAIELDTKILKGPGFLWRFMRNIDKKPPNLADRIEYLEAELAKPVSERLLKVPELDDKQRMYKK